MSPNDEILIQLFNQGGKNSEKAFNEIVAFYGPKFKRELMKQLKEK